jgi:hypothetical protein
MTRVSPFAAFVVPFLEVAEDAGSLDGLMASVWVSSSPQARASAAPTRKAAKGTSRPGWPKLARRVTGKSFL